MVILYEIDFWIKFIKLNFLVIADEATESSNVEQLSINVHFLENGEPQEKFLGFQECISGTTGETIVIIFYQSLLTGS